MAMCIKLTMGYIKLYRDLQEWEWYGEPNMVAFWIHLLINANWTEKCWRGETVGRGQLLSSISSLSTETGLSVKQVRTALARLVDGNFIVTQGASKWTKITICNYDSYYIDGDSEGRTNGNQKASEGQTEGKQRATPKEYKEYQENKEEKKTSNDVKEKAKRFVPPTVDEVRAFCEEHGYAVDAYHFVNYYASKGWVVGKSPLKDWKAAVRTWVRKREELAPQNQTPPKPTRTFTSGFKIASGGGLLDGIEY